MKKIFLVALFFFSSVAFAEVTSETYCFSSGEKKPINFEMRIYSDKNTKWRGGFIKYENSKSLIPIVLKAVVSEVIDLNRPYQLTQVWSEINEDRISGEYEMMSQGANIYSMVYTNFKRQKKYTFLLNTNVISSDDCKIN